MKKLKITVFLCLFLYSFNLIAQDTIPVSQASSKTTLGLGLGLDYGGVGANMLVYTNKNIGFFGGFGYAVAGIGFNAGTKIRIVSEKHFTDPYFLAMYGYNAAIKIKGAEGYNKLFYGPTFGFGLDFRTKRVKKGYWTVALLVPIRNSAVNEYIDAMKNDGVEFKNELLPITYSIGYRFLMK